LTCALLLFCACSALTAAGCTTVKPSAKTKVSATIEPLADFCRNVGGNLVEVETLIPPGASSHVFEPTASQFVFVSQAIKKVGSAGMVVVVTADAAPKDKLIKAGAFNGEKGSPGAPYDPHIWLDPTIAMYQVDAIRDGFIKADPAHAAAYRANAAAYNAKLAALDREIMAKTATFKSRAFVALHPGWTYFSRRYAITQAGAVQEASRSPIS
jgi:zinc transport system substrate-binding protein